MGQHHCAPPTQEGEGHPSNVAWQQQEQKENKYDKL